MSCPDCGCPVARHNAVNRVDGERVAHCADCGCCWRTKGMEFADRVFAEILSDRMSMERGS